MLEAYFYNDNVHINADDTRTLPTNFNKLQQTTRSFMSAAPKSYVLTFNVLVPKGISNPTLQIGGHNTQECWYNDTQVIRADHNRELLDL